MTCTTKPGAKDTTKGFQRTVAVPSEKEKISCYREEKGFGGEDNAQQAQQRCRGVGRDMGQVGLNFGGRAWPVRQAGTRKVERRKKKTLTKKKKNDFKKKIRY